MLSSLLSVHLLKAGGRMWVCRKEGAAVFCQRAEFFLKVRLCLRSAWCWWEGGRGRSELQVKGVKLIKDFAGKPHRELIRLSGNLEMEARNWKLAGGKICGGFLLRVTDRRRWLYHFHNQHCQGVWITALGPSAWLFLVLLSVWIFMWLWKLAWNETANRVPTKVVRQRRNQSTSRVWTHDCLLLSCTFLMFANVFFCLVTPETKLKSSPGSSLQVACVLGI